MSGQQDIVSPTDSVSNASNGKKQRLGKAQRAARRDATPSQASATTAQTSMSGAAMFARKASYAPIPQPGRYPIVFPSGAGEPTRDSHIALDGNVLFHAFSQLGETFVNSDKYAEFSSNAVIPDDDFKKEVTVSAVLSLAQQLVHAHVNMGLPIGDFSSISSTDVYTMNSVRAIVTQFGEFSVESLGTRYVFKDYGSEIHALVRLAHAILANGSDVDEMENDFNMHWLPTKANDPRTSFILANRINGYFQRFGIQFQVEELTSALFNREPAWFKNALDLIPEADRNGLRLLFSGYTSAAAFSQKFSGQDGDRLLNNLQLSWSAPAPGHCAWGLVPKTRFPEIAESWVRKRPSLAKFFHCSSGQMEKSNATGTAAQLALVETVSGVTIIKARVALSAPEFSLLACFPSSVYTADLDERRVVLTTSIPVKVKGIEFLQLDWRA